MGGAGLAAVSLNRAIRRKARPVATIRHSPNTVIGMFVIEIAQGEDGAPYSALGALGGVTYVIAMVVLRLRR